VNAGCLCAASLPRRPTTSRRHRPFARLSARRRPVVLLQCCCCAVSSAVSRAGRQLGFACTRARRGERRALYRIGLPSVYTVQSLPLVASRVLRSRPLPPVATSRLSPTLRIAVPHTLTLTFTLTSTRTTTRAASSTPGPYCPSRLPLLCPLLPAPACQSLGAGHCSSKSPTQAGLRRTLTGGTPRRASGLAHSRGACSPPRCCYCQGVLSCARRLCAPLHRNSHC
jgi:hypothetical protein